MNKSEQDGGKERKRKRSNIPVSAPSLLRLFSFTIPPPSFSSLPFYTSIFPSVLPSSLTPSSSIPFSSIPPPTPPPSASPSPPSRSPPPPSPSPPSSPPRPPARPTSCPAPPLPPSLPLPRPSPCPAPSDPRGRGTLARPRRKGQIVKKFWSAERCRPAVRGGGWALMFSLSRGLEDAGDA